MQNAQTASTTGEIRLEYLIQYGMFLAKAVTIVVAIVIVVGSIADCLETRLVKKVRSRLLISMSILMI